MIKSSLEHISGFNSIPCGRTKANIGTLRYYISNFVFELSTVNQQVGDSVT